MELVNSEDDSAEYSVALDNNEPIHINPPPKLEKFNLNDYWNGEPKKEIKWKKH